MTDLSSTLLSWMLSYGAPLFGLVLFTAAAGIPLPTSLLVVAAGAFSRQEALTWYLALPLGLLGAVLGDSLDFGLGRFGRKRVLQRFGGTSTWIQAEKTFNRYGGLAVFFTRFLFTAIALPTNLLAGTGGYPFIRFLVFDVSGEFIWLAVYGGLGYLFGNQWETISQLMGDFSGLIIGVLLLGAGIWTGLKVLRKTGVSSQTILRHNT